MANGMNGDQLAEEVLRAIGGEVNEHRHEAFRRLCRAIVAHIQNNEVVTSVITSGTQTGNTCISTKVQ